MLRPLEQPQPFRFCNDVKTSAKSIDPLRPRQPTDRRKETKALAHPRIVLPAGASEVERDAGLAKASPIGGDFDVKQMGTV